MTIRPDEPDGAQARALFFCLAFIFARAGSAAPQTEDKGCGSRCKSSPRMPQRKTFPNKNSTKTALRDPL
jgi:hypothetical protein